MSYLNNLGGEELIAMLIDPSPREEAFGGASPGEIGDELLDRVDRGFPAERILSLFESESEVALGTGLFLLDELGERLSPIAGALVQLVAGSRHPWGVARTVCRALLELPDLDTPTLTTVARLLSGLGDPDSESDDGEVLFCVLRILRRATSQQLGEVASSVDDARLSELVTWLRVVGSDPENEKRIAAQLDDDDEVAAVIAVVAAGRIGDRVKGPLLRAAESSQPAIRDFARSELGLGRRGTGRWNL